MDKLAFKNQVLEAAKKRQQEIIDDFKDRINELRSSEGDINDGQYELDQSSQNVVSNEEINILADELNFVVEEMNLLNRMNVGDHLHEEVSPVSVVKTNKLTFFPSVSVEKFNVDGEEFFGISTKAPIYAAMQHKKAGESFQFNDNEYKIEEVY